MLRQRLRRKESDRFISGRSLSRNKQIEEYLINDNEEDTKNTNNNNPIICSDEKESSKKLYLSLLKKQIFEKDLNKGPNLSSTGSKKSQKSSLYKVLSAPTKTLIDYSDYGNVVRKLNFEFEDNSYHNSVDTLTGTHPINHIKLNFDDVCPNQRKIPRAPYKVLDAPSLRDDFYLHLLDWSSNDLLAVGLDKSVYLWDAKTSSVNLLTSFQDEQVTSIVWLKENHLLGVGSQSGKVHIWDVNKSTCINKFSEHTDRVAVLNCLNKKVFSSGSQDHSIINYDIRLNKSISKFNSHTQEVCGLRWSPDERILASGGNDNKIILWSLAKSNPITKFTEHTSAVKALGWSPHKYGLLASGGGTQDRSIKFWNTNSMKLINSYETSSQVCNLTFSKNTQEFITTHGYSDNLIVVWSYPKMEVVTSLKGHKERVIYLSMSPDGEKIVTGAGDETVRFWEIFKSDKKKEINEKENILTNFSLR